MVIQEMLLAKLIQEHVDHVITGAYRLEGTNRKSNNALNPLIAGIISGWVSERLIEAYAAGQEAMRERAIAGLTNAEKQKGSIRIVRAIPIQPLPKPPTNERN